MNAIVGLHRMQPAPPAPAEARNARGHLPSAPTTPETISFFIARGGHLKILQSSGDVVLRANEACLIDGRGADQIVTAGQGNPIRVLIAKARLFALYPLARQVLDKPFPVSIGLTQLLGNYLLMMGNLSPQLDASAQQLASQHIVELVALAIGASRALIQGSQERAQGAVRLDQIKSDILQNIGRADMTLDEIARRHRASPRYIQRLFEKESTSISAFVLEHRLRLAAKLLADPLQADRKISDIAFSSGFNDLSYFNRAFRRRFDVTPSEARAGHVQQAAPLPLSG